MPGDVESTTAVVQFKFNEVDFLWGATLARFSRRRHESHGFRNRRTIGSFLFAPIRGLFDSFVGEADSLGGQLPLQKRIARGFLKLLFFPIFCVWQFLQFVVLSWTTTRSLSSFLWGLFPLAIAVSIVTLEIAWPFIEVRSATRVHREYTNSAESSGEFQAGLLGSKRVQLLTSEPKYRFIHALSLEKAGLTDNADAIMHELATFQKDCFPQAHMYLVGKLIAEYEKDNSKTEGLEIALKHVRQVMAVEPSMQAQVYIGIIQMGLGNIDQAMEIFKLVSVDYPTVVPDLAKYLLEQGKHEEASVHIQRGLTRLRAYAEVNPEDPMVWQTMFSILVLNEDFSKAINEFNKAFASVESPMVKLQLKTLQSNVMIEYCKKFEDDDSVDGLKKRLKVMSQAVAFNPRSPPALERFIDLVLYSGNEEFEKWLDDDARDDIVPGIFQLMNGVRSVMNGTPDVAQKQFRLALGESPESAIIIYDIARVIAHTKGKPDDALRLINTAVDTFSNPVLNFGRGDILMSLNRNSEALTELEYAAELMTTDPYVFEILANCRDALGDSTGAAAARTRAEEIKSERITKNLMPDESESR